MMYVFWGGTTICCCCCMNFETSGSKNDFVEKNCHISIGLFGVQKVMYEYLATLLLPQALRLCVTFCLFVKGFTLTKSS